MKRLNIWQESRKMIAENKVVCTGYSDLRNKEFWDVAGVGIEVTTELYGKVFCCTCKHCSIYAGANAFCSYKAAVITKMVMQNNDNSAK